MLQVYPEPRSESECLSNIREFLRGCGASLRLEVSGSVRGDRGAGVHKGSVGARDHWAGGGAGVGRGSRDQRGLKAVGPGQRREAAVPIDLVRGPLPGKG